MPQVRNSMPMARSSNGRTKRLDRFGVGSTPARAVTIFVVSRKEKKGETMKNQELNPCPLKPCPFCGKEAVLTKHVGRVRCVKKNVYRGPFYFIGCADPNCILYNDGRRVRLIFKSTDLGVVVRRWNRRRGERVPAE